MLTLVSSNQNTSAAPQTQSAETAKGQELLLSFMMWEQKFEQDSHEIFDDPIDVFLTAQGEKSLQAV